MIYVVLGMHKSGTTLVARTLQESGIDMGGGDDAGYEHGAFCERPETMALNKRLLVEGQHVFSLDVYRPYRGEPPEALQSAAADLVLTLNSRHGDWGFKDPRTCLAWPLWRDTLQDYRAVGVWRSAAEVFSHYMKGRRLYSRSGLRRGFRILRAWYAYNRAMLEIHDARPDRSMVLNYRDFMLSDETFAALQGFLEHPLVDCRRPEMYRRKASNSPAFRLQLLVSLLAGRWIAGLERALVSRSG